MRLPIASKKQHKNAAFSTLLQQLAIFSLSLIPPPPISLSLQILQALRKHREQREKNQNKTKKEKSLTSGSQLTPERSRQPCPRGAGPLAPGRGLSPGGWSPEPSPPSLPCPAAPSAPAPSREERRGSSRTGQRQEGAEGGEREEGDRILGGQDELGLSCSGIPIWQRLQLARDRAQGPLPAAGGAQGGRSCLLPARTALGAGQRGAGRALRRRRARKPAGGRGSPAAFRSIAARPAKPLSSRLGSGWSREEVRAEGWQSTRQKEVAVGDGRRGKNL